MSENEPTTTQDPARAEHARWIERRGYPVPPGAGLDDPERALIERYGYWLQALADRLLAPLTPAQERFVLVAAGHLHPVAPFEIAWLKCREQAGPQAQVKEVQIATRLARVEAARVSEEILRDDYEAKRAAILNQVAPQLEALDAEFAPRLTKLREDASRLEADAKAAVLEYGAPFTYGRMRARFQRGAVRWDAKALAQYAESHPEIAAFRKVGRPYVALVLRRAQAASASEGAHGASGSGK